VSRIDHIVVGVRDHAAAARRLWDQYGLEAQPGGAHAGAGTANMLVPVGDDQFLELLAVTDPQSRHPIVRWLSALVSNGDRLLALAIEPDDLDATAARLAQPTIAQDRVYADGRRVSFRLTGVAGLLGPDILPFFVETTVGREWRCGSRSPSHRLAASGVEWVELGSDAARVRAQLGDGDLPITVVAGRAGVSAIGLELDGGEVALRF
jgi:hypothetical protein